MYSYEVRPGVVNSHTTAALTVGLKESVKTVEGGETKVTVILAKKASQQRN